MIKELTFERVYKVLADKVWDAWTSPDKIKQWWGPDNATIPEVEIDLRVGGKIYIVMEAGEAMGPYKGTKWPMLGEFTIVEPRTRLSYEVQAWTEGQKEDTTIDQNTDVSLIEQNGQTKLVIKAAILKAGPGASMAVEGMQYGFTQQLEKLDKFLAAH